MAARTCNFSKEVLIAYVEAYLFTHQEVNPGVLAPMGASKSMASDVLSRYFKLNEGCVTYKGRYKSHFLNVDSKPVLYTPEQHEQTLKSVEYLSNLVREQDNEQN